MPNPSIRARYPLVAFDLDGTLVRHHEPIWKTLHEALGSDPARRRDVLARARAGRISYAEWFESDLAMLRDAGARRDDLVSIARRLEPAPGAVDLVRDLRAAGAAVAVISGGLDLVLETVLPGLALDAVHINRIRFAADGSIEGGTPTDYDLDHKAKGLRGLALERGLSLADTAFVGDGPNDVEIARVAGFSIAWNTAPPALRAASRVHVEGPDLAALRPFLFDQ